MINQGTLKIVKCKICGDKVEDPHESGIKICFGCRIDSFIPKNYQKREEYSKDNIDRISCATKRPVTGIDLLDEKSGMPLCSIGDMIDRGTLKRMRYLENRKGFEDDNHRVKEL